MGHLAAPQYNQRFSKHLLICNFNFSYKITFSKPKFSEQRFAFQLIYMDKTRVFAAISVSAILGKLGPSLLERQDSRKQDDMMFVLDVFVFAFVLDEFVLPAGEEVKSLLVVVAHHWWAWLRWCLCLVLGRWWWMCLCSMCFWCLVGGGIVCDCVCVCGCVR